MFSIVTQALLGLLFESFGIFLIYYYVTGIDAGRSSLVLIVSIVLIIMGIVLLLRAGKSDATFVRKPDQMTVTPTEEGKTLQKNNDLVKRWKRTMDQRDRLKLLSLRGDEDKN